MSATREIPSGLTLARVVGLSVDSFDASVN